VDSRHDSLVMSHETTRHSFRLLRRGASSCARTMPPTRRTIDSVRRTFTPLPRSYEKDSTLRVCDFTHPMASSRWNGCTRQSTIDTKTSTPAPNPDDYDEPRGARRDSRLSQISGDRARTSIRARSKKQVMAVRIGFHPAGGVCGVWRIRRYEPR